MMSNELAIRYAIYTRQSVARPADFSSCDAQFSKCQLFIDQQKNENLVWVGVHFNDEGESGGTLDRPAMTRLRELVQSRGVDRIYVAALDRLARRAYDLSVHLIWRTRNRLKSRTSQRVEWLAELA